MIIAHLSDLHVRPTGVPAYRVVESTMLAERALAAVRNLSPRPDAVVISGDLTDCGLASEYALLAAMLRRYLGGLPVYLIPGNHDRRNAFRAALGGWPGVTEDPEFVQYAVENLPVRLLMLDSVVPGAGHGELCPARMEWLATRLAEAPNRPTILALHHPPITCGLRVLDGINLRTAPALAALLAQNRQVERVLCGHHHRPITGRIAGAVVVVAPSVAHQGSFELEDDEGRFTLEPPGFCVHLHLPDGSVVSHGVLVETYPGPYPYLPDPDYPGSRPE